MNHDGAARPNVLLILADDLGWTDLGCYGSTFYETPNIDKLAAAGTRFSQAYASSPVCSPSRASLMTGKYPARVGITNWIGGQAVGRLNDVPYFHGLPENEYSLARALHDSGYQTWHVGKWHLGDKRSSPQAHGFDINIGGGAVGSPSTYFSPYNLPALSDGPDGEYLTERLTDEAIRLIRSRDDQRPFFLNLWHYAVHTPCEAPPDLVEKYEDKARRLGLDTEAIDVGEPMPAWHLTGINIRRRTVQSDPVYAAMIETLDDSVGALLAALDDTSQLDNTVIIFASDNGGLSTAEGSPTCNLPLAEGKGWMDDGGIRVPLIIAGPGVTAGRTDDLPTSTPDLYPTVCETAAATPGNTGSVDGVSLWPTLHGVTREHPPLYWHYPHYSNQGGTPTAAVRDGHWKLIRYFEDGHQELFNLVDDVSESRDLINTAPAATVDRLTAQLDQWLDNVGAIVPRPNLAGPQPWADLLVETRA